MLWQMIVITIHFLKLLIHSDFFSLYRLNLPPNQITYLINDSRYFYHIKPTIIFLIYVQIQEHLDSEINSSHFVYQKLLLLI